MDKRIPILRELHQIHSKLIDVYHKSSQDNIMLLEFCKFYRSFVKLLNPTISNKRFDYIFTPVPDLTNKNVLNAHLHTAGEYAETLITRIEKDTQLDLSNELVGILFDYPRLFNAVENIYNIPFGDFAGSRNMKVDSNSSYNIAVQIFWAPQNIQRSNSLNGYAIFALRQAIELAGKELIGLDNILNEDQTVFLYGTQKPWEFINFYKDKPYFYFPFNPSEMQTIFQWSNHFVHTGQNALCYATALALTTVEQLYQKKKFIHFLHGHEDFRYANEISNYTELKEDFEDYLKQNKEKPKFARWAPSPNLSAITG